MTLREHFTGLALSTAVAISAFAQPAFSQETSKPRPSQHFASKADIAKNRTILTLPAVRNGGPIGEMIVAIDNDGDAIFEVSSVVIITKPLISLNAQGELVGLTSGKDFIHPDVLADFGINLRFDMGRLEVVLDGIDLRLVKVRNIGASLTDKKRREPTVGAGDFSAYLTLAGNLDYSGGEFSDGFTNPDILGFGTIRAGRAALQYEGGLTERGLDGYGLYRRFVRGIYDFEDKDLRLSAGDLQVDTLPVFSTQLLGGIGIERRRRIFTPFNSAFELGGRQIQVNSPSTIEIVSNGQLIQTIPVDEGVFDLQQLPLINGANDVDIIVRDAAGRTSVTNFNYFYDPVDLEVGDFEYGAYVGLISDLDSIQPEYSGDIAGTAFYRRAFSPSLLIGGAVQAAGRSQAVAGEVRWVPQVVPGTFDTHLALSNAESSQGYAARVGYRWGRSTSNGGRQASFLIDYESSGFSPLSRPAFLSEESLNITANYGQNLTRRTYISGGVNYFKRGNSAARTTTFVDLLHQFTPRLRGTLGAEYSENDGLNSDIGIRAGLTLLVGQRSRLSSAYESRRDLYRASYSKGLENRVGAFGYDATMQSTDGRSLADASLRYSGNRFDGRVLLSGSGRGFDNVLDSRRAQMQISTSLAYADGAFGIGRPISDGFAVVTPHPAIDGEVIVGNRLNDGEYQAKSGPLGAAVVQNIIGYESREVIYDIDSTDKIYDIGDGADRISVPTGGGARIMVGDFRYVSAIGTLTSGGQPVALSSGTITSSTDVGFPTGRFFTNYIGRFSIFGLAPGEVYEVKVIDGREFSISVPVDSEGLLRVDDIEIEEITE